MPRQQSHRTSDERSFAKFERMRRAHHEMFSSESRNHGAAHPLCSRERVCKVFRSAPDA
jgi:hypothetical protein